MSKIPVLDNYTILRVDYFPIINPMYLSFSLFFFPSRKQFCLGSDTTSQSVENHEETRILYVPYFGAKIQTFEDFCSNFPFQEFSIFLPTV